MCVFMDGGIWGMCVFADRGIWGMEDRRVDRIENGGNLTLSVYTVCTNKPYHTELLDNNEIT